MTYLTTKDGLPAFFRGEVGEWDAPYCDFLAPERDGDACDGQPAYVIHWKPVPAADLDSLPCSGVCLEHVTEVDRNLVSMMFSHPDATRSEAEGGQP